METLPPEMVEEVGQYLTPRDLSSCIAVSRRWRDTFNNDSLWQQHCDPSLVEPLEKTPCVVEPRFVSPEVDNSTLTPISYWRMAFLREQHLWKNYKQINHKEHEIQEHDIGSDFLSNALLVRRFENRIEIWDVSIFPACIIASVNVEGIYYFKVFRTNRLLVSHKGSVKVFHVDPSKNNVIELLHDISVESRTPDHPFIEDLLHCISGSTYIHVNANRLTMDVIDLEKGMKIKTESSPVMRRENQNATIHEIKSSTNSQYVIVTVLVRVPGIFGEECHCYVYSVGQLVFSSSPIVKHNIRNARLYVINGDYLAYSYHGMLKIYNCFTLELVSERSTDDTVHPHVFNDGFVCKFWNRNLEQNFIERFSLTSKSWIPVFHLSFNNHSTIKVINNKFINCGVDVLEASGQTLRRSDIPAISGDIINESFTRGVTDDSRGLYVHYYW